MASKTYWIKNFIDDDMPLNGDAQPFAGLNASLRADRATDELIGLIKGVLADKVLADSEAIFLRTWFHANPDIVESFPGKQVYQRIERIFADGVITDEEREDLRTLLGKVTGVDSSAPPIPANPATRALFEEPEPEITFSKASFSFTGKFVSGTRDWCIQQTEQAGGEFHSKPQSHTRFLVIGTLGSRDWAHTSFGRKIEAAMRYRPPLKIVSEKHWCSNLPTPP